MRFPSMKSLKGPSLILAISLFQLTIINSAQAQHEHRYPTVKNTFDAGVCLTTTHVAKATKVAHEAKWSDFEAWNKRAKADCTILVEGTPLSIVGKAGPLLQVRTQRGTIVWIAAETVFPAGS